MIDELVGHINTISSKAVLKIIILGMVLRYIHRKCIFVKKGTLILTISDSIIKRGRKNIMATTGEENRVQRCALYDYEEMSNV